jgi:hypothetical protein
VDAIIPRMTAVVPQEQNGVATATPVEMSTLFFVFRRRNRPIASWSTYSFSAALIRMLINSKYQLCENVSRTLLKVYCRREMISILTFDVCRFIYRT